LAGSRLRPRSSARKMRAGTRDSAGGGAPASPARPGRPRGPAPRRRRASPRRAPDTPSRRS
jgi:hypothetical protein